MSSRKRNPPRPNHSDDWRKDATIGGNEPWIQPDEYILKRMRKVGGWFGFGEYDNISAVVRLINSRQIEVDENWNNRISGMVTSIRARAALQGGRENMSMGQKAYSAMTEAELQRTIELAPRVTGGLHAPLLTCAQMMANSNADNAQRELSKRQRNKNDQTRPR